MADCGLRIAEGTEPAPSIMRSHQLSAISNHAISYNTTTTNAVTALSSIELYVFVLAGFVGYQVITRVPPLLHTPLMSATNAISGISLVGSIVAAGVDHGTVSTVLGFIAVVAATINVVGGFLITDRMLKMFRRETRKP